MTDRLAPAAEVVDFCCCYESRIGAEDAADDVVGRPRRGRCCRRRSSAAGYGVDVRNTRLGDFRPLAFTVVPQARECIAKLRLSLVYCLGYNNEATGDHHYREADEDRVDDGSQYEKSWNDHRHSRHGDGRISPTNQRTSMNVSAVAVEDRMLTAKSTGGSVATRPSCEMRASGFWWSPRTRLSNNGRAPAGA